MRPTNECRCNLQSSKFRLILCHHPIKSIYGYVDGFGNNDDKICFNLINCKNIKLIREQIYNHLSKKISLLISFLKAVIVINEGRTFGFRYSQYIYRK